MYNCIVLESGTLPAGVSLATILDGCAEEVIAEVLQNIPETQAITQDVVETTGEFIKRHWNAKCAGCIANKI